MTRLTYKTFSNSGLGLYMRDIEVIGSHLNFFRVTEVPKEPVKLIEYVVRIVKTTSPHLKSDRVSDLFYSVVHTIAPSPLCGFPI